MVTASLVGSQAGSAIISQPAWLGLFRQYQKVLLSKRFRGRIHHIIPILRLSDLRLPSRGERWT
jgi:hypothetical protein